MPDEMLFTHDEAVLAGANPKLLDLFAVYKKQKREEPLTSIRDLSTEKLEAMVKSMEEVVEIIKDLPQTELLAFGERVMKLALKDLPEDIVKRVQAETADPLRGH